MFTFETMVSFCILSLTSLTVFTAIHTAYEQIEFTNHRTIGQQIAWQYTVEAKHTHFRGIRCDSPKQQGTDYQVEVIGNSTTHEIHTEVIWHEKTGIQKQIELDAFDFVPDAIG